MQSESDGFQRKCYGCQRVLEDGVRFSVACGTHNYSANSTRLMSAMSEIKVSTTRSKVERFKYWWRLLASGIRR